MPSFQGHFTLVWGALRAHHPDFVNQTIHADSFFLAHWPHILACSKEKEYKKYLANLFETLPELPKHEPLQASTNLVFRPSPLYAFSTGWIKRKHQKYLTQLAHYPHTKHPQSNSKPQSTTPQILPTPAQRALGIAQLWNTLLYHGATQPAHWHTTLEQALRRAEAVLDYKGYLFILQELSAQAQHLGLPKNYWPHLLGKYRLPILLREYNEAFFVQTCLDSSSLQAQDRLFILNDFTLQNWAKQIAPLIPQSHPTKNKAWLAHFLRFQSRNTARLEVHRNTQTFETQIQNLDSNTLQTFIPQTQIIQDSLLYLAAETPWPTQHITKHNIKHVIIDARYFSDNALQADKYLPQITQTHSYWQSSPASASFWTQHTDTCTHGTDTLLPHLKYWILIDAHASSEWINTLSAWKNHPQVTFVGTASPKTYSHTKTFLILNEIPLRLYTGIPYPQFVALPPQLLPDIEWKPEHPSHWQMWPIVLEHYFTQQEEK